MSSSFSGSTSTSPNPACSSSNDSSDAFTCNICLEAAQEPVVTLCGHLYCWPCLYKWLRGHAQSPKCPVCNALVEEKKLVPLYGRGKNPTDPRSKPVPGVEIPNRPTGQRPPTAPQPEPNQNPNLNPFHNVNWGGGYGFGFGSFGLFPTLSFQINGFPGAGYGFGGGYNQFGYGNPNPVHGGPAYRYNVPRDQQQDRNLKMLLIIVGVLVVASLISF
jgi:E3 ubiquitin-protein ligase RNF5